MRMVDIEGFLAAEPLSTVASFLEKTLEVWGE